jgi:transposase
MSTSPLYHAFGIRGYAYVRTDYPDGQVIFTIRQETKACRCSACGAREVRPRGHVERRFRSLPIGGRATSVALPIPRVECRACGAVRQVAVPFADPRRSYTNYPSILRTLNRCFFKLTTMLRSISIERLVNFRLLMCT